jgi:hypothetical protein
MRISFIDGVGDSVVHGVSRRHVSCSTHTRTHTTWRQSVHVYNTFDALLHLRTFGGRHRSSTCRARDVAIDWAIVSSLRTRTRATHDMAIGGYVLSTAHTRARHGVSGRMFLDARTRTHATRGVSGAPHVLSTRTRTRTRTGSVDCYVVSRHAHTHTTLASVGAMFRLRRPRARTHDMASVGVMFLDTHDTHARTHTTHGVEVGATMFSRHLHAHARAHAASSLDLLGEYLAPTSSSQSPLQPIFRLFQTLLDTLEHSRTSHSKFEIFTFVDFSQMSILRSRRYLK